MDIGTSAYNDSIIYFGVQGKKAPMLCLGDLYFMDIKAKKEDKSVSFIISSNYFFKLDIENIDEKRDVVDKNKFGILISRLTGEEKEHLTRIFLRLIYIFLFYLIT